MGSRRRLHQTLKRGNRHASGVSGSARQRVQTYIERMRRLVVKSDVWLCRRKASPNREVKAIIEKSREQAGLMKAGISVKAFGPQARPCIALPPSSPGISPLISFMVNWFTGNNDFICERMEWNGSCF